MAPYEDWNKAEEEDEDELQDASFFEAKRDIVVFCIDCFESMHTIYEDPRVESRKISHVFAALEAAMEVQKRKVVVGPNDSVGILLFNTTRRNERKTSETEYKNGTYVYQAIQQISAEKIKNLILLLGDALKSEDALRVEFPPVERRIPMGDVFTSCNWLFRDGAPKTGLKRIFLLTDEDNPHPGPKSAQLITSAATTLDDLTQAGIIVEPFFISTSEKPFDPSKFYSSVLQSAYVPEEDENSEALLPESISISRIDDLLSQMRIREQPKRSQFRIPFELADGFVIGVRGYGLITEQKKGLYKYFMNLSDGLELVEPKTTLVDEEEQNNIERDQILYGMTFGVNVATGGDDDDLDSLGTRAVPARSKVFFTADEIKSFRTVGLEPGLKLLGFKDQDELQEEDNIKHSTFIHPDELAYAGSRRTFTALLKTLHKKKKIGIVRAVTRRNSASLIYALLPQMEKTDETGWVEPSGFHLIPFPFADDLRAAPVETACRASPDLVKAAKAFVDKLKIKDGSYPPDANPNPALAFHYAQLEATAFRQEYDPTEFEDLTEPNYDIIHRRVGPLIKDWKAIVEKDDSSRIINVTSTSAAKRKADVSVDDAEIRSKYESGQLSKLRVDQLKDFLKSKSQSVSGKKGELLERVSDWLSLHS